MPVVGLNTSSQSQSAASADALFSFNCENFMENAQDAPDLNSGAVEPAKIKFAAAAKASGPSVELSPLRRRGASAKS
jgi:hypothetical protein